MRRYTVDLDYGSVKYKNMVTNVYYDVNGARQRQYRAKHISETPYDILYKSKRNVKRANKILTGIRYAVRWNKENIRLITRTR
jgi:hypothetical protein